MRKLIFAIVFMMAMPFVNAQKWEFVGLHCKDTPQSEFMPLESKGFIDLDKDAFSLMTEDGLFIRFNIDKVETSYEDGYSSLIMSNGIWQVGMHESDDEKIVLLLFEGKTYSGILVTIKE